mmetsp:Transcript_12255/g.43020  ORF Transcript_12255/g.43020 Transcript_12255/m.43020 type:complete len:285 (+) Transcript_12255:361-1215(+)
MSAAQCASSTSSSASALISSLVIGASSVGRSRRGAAHLAAVSALDSAQSASSSVSSSARALISSVVIRAARASNAAAKTAASASAPAGSTVVHVLRNLGVEARPHPRDSAVLALLLIAQQQGHGGRRRAVAVSRTTSTARRATPATVTVVRSTARALRRRRHQQPILSAVHLDIADELLERHSRAQLWIVLSKMTHSLQRADSSLLQVPHDPCWRHQRVGVVGIAVALAVMRPVAAGSRAWRRLSKRHRLRHCSSRHSIQRLRHCGLQRRSGGACAERSGHGSR